MTSNPVADGYDTDIRSCGDLSDEMWSSTKMLAKYCVEHLVVYRKRQTADNKSVWYVTYCPA